MLSDFGVLNRLSGSAFKLEAVPYDNLSAATKILNEDLFEYFLFVKVPAEIAHKYELYQAELLTKDEVVPLRDEDWEHDLGRIWYRVRASVLKKTPGKHVYRLHFIDPKTEHVISLYFSYVYQTSRAEKPYIYMKGDGGDKS